MTTSSESTSPPSPRRHEVALAYVRLSLELVLVVATVIAAIAAALSASAAKEAAITSSDQVWQSSYQSVYERQLQMYEDLDDPEVARYIFDGQQMEREEWPPELDIALRYALDYYNYVFVQTAPLKQSSGDQHLILAPSEEPPPVAPPDIDPVDWNSWITWSNTIRGGIAEAPNLCDKMNESKSAYIVEFVTAVEEACGP